MIGSDRITHLITVYAAAFPRPGVDLQLIQRLGCHRKYKEPMSDSWGAMARSMGCDCKGDRRVIKNAVVRSCRRIV